MSLISSEVIYGIVSLRCQLDSGFAIALLCLSKPLSPFVCSTYGIGNFFLLPWVSMSRPTGTDTVDAAVMRELAAELLGYCRQAVRQLAALEKTGVKLHPYNLGGIKNRTSPYPPLFSAVDKALLEWQISQDKTLTADQMEAETKSLELQTIPKKASIGRDSIPKRKR